MKIDIYKSANCGDKYLSVAKGTKIEGLSLPDSIDPDLLSLSPIRTRLEIDAKTDHKALDQADIITQIEKQGYAIHGVKFVISLGA